MTICAYHSNLYFDTFQEHVAEMKSKGFDTILFTITETDLLFNLETFQEFRVYAESQGMETWATFWGLTAGEAICKECNIKKWICAVKGIGFNDVMIDEPKKLSDIKAFTDHTGFNFHLCLCDLTFNSLTDKEIINIPVKSIGVSCYHWTTNWYKIKQRSKMIAQRLVLLKPNNNFIFIQGFDILKGMEQLPLVVKQVCEVSGIKDFAFWSFKCTAATASKRPVNHKQIWETIQF